MWCLKECGLHSGLWAEQQQQLLISDTGAAASMMLIYLTVIGLDPCGPFNGQAALTTHRRFSASLHSRSVLLLIVFISASAFVKFITMTIKAFIQHSNVQRL